MFGTTTAGFVPLQTPALGSSLLALAGTFLLATVTLGLSAHLAVRFVQGRAEPVNALLAGPPTAAVLTLGQWWGLEPVLWLGSFLAVAPLVLWGVYDLDRRETAIATLAQYTMVIGLGSMVNTLLG